MTRQRFYEMCLMKTFERARFDDMSQFHELSERVFGESENPSLNQFLMRSELMGVPIPRKQDFRKWGVKYLVQLLGFAVESGDGEFTRSYFRFLEENPSLYSKDRKLFGDFCWSVLMDNLLKDRDLSRHLAGFMYVSFEGLDWYSRFTSVASTLCLIDWNVLDRKKQTGKE